MSKFLKSVIFSIFISSACTSAYAGDVDAGKKVFKKCKSCHLVGDGAKHKAGPHLNDVFGRTAGVVEGFKFSKAMIAAGKDGLVWNDETMDKFITKPKSMVKKTKMAFSGLKKEEDRTNLIAYLKSFFFPHTLAISK